MYPRLFGRTSGSSLAVTGALQHSRQRYWSGPHEISSSLQVFLDSASSPAARTRVWPGLEASCPGSSESVSLPAPPSVADGIPKPGPHPLEPVSPKTPRQERTVAFSLFTPPSYQFLDQDPRPSSAVSRIAGKPPPEEERDARRPDHRPNAFPPPTAALLPIPGKRRKRRSWQENP
ncbi:hypothetical protein CPLU01_12208 [Colletotrichum plurivorum]|uniref:Uncharacterized protein n=1 Tax=Colletotrichum plurivorum TaxID=2175906 RepID=A0A8H6JZ66_9PEZI|nr:hypothetical protein CPLU01_12208 [Colletotrichum plurivorum]